MNPKTKTLSVTMWIAQADLLERAAKKQGISKSEIMREASLPLAAQILGIDLPEFSSFEKKGFRRGRASIAASFLGISPKQFRKEAIEDRIEKVIKEMEQQELPHVPTRSTARLGTRRRIV